MICQTGVLFLGSPGRFALPIYFTNSNAKDHSLFDSRTPTLQDSHTHLSSMLNSFWHWIAYFCTISSHHHTYKVNISRREDRVVQKLRI